MVYQLVTFWMTLNLTFKVKGQIHKFGPVTQERSHIEILFQVLPYIVAFGHSDGHNFDDLELDLKVNGKVRCHFHTFDHVTREACHLET